MVQILPGMPQTEQRFLTDAVRQLGRQRRYCQHSQQAERIDIQRVRGRKLLFLSERITLPLSIADSSIRIEGNGHPISLALQPAQ